jgi:very-long-chain (3R)-3-hydroxyacyl-CoA dehydratase
MGPKEMYLIVYNICACVGWSVVLASALQTLAKGVPEDGLWEALSNVYATEGLAAVLTYSQTAALLEILHAAVGLVRSPVVVTAMQVMSRIVALVAINYSPEAQSK